LKNPRLDLPDGQPKNRNARLQFLLPGGEGRDEGGRKTQIKIYFLSTPRDFRAREFSTTVQIFSPRGF
jgi:hypothetical protein